MLEFLKKFIEPAVVFAPEIPAIILGIVVGILIIKLLSKLLAVILKVSRVPKALSGIIVSLASIVLWVLLFAELARDVGLSSVAITVSGSLIALGLAVSKGATSLTSDIIAGVFVANDNDFEVGYRVKTGNTEGVVDMVDIRKVRVKDDEGNLHIIPNSSLDTSGWIVIERNEKSDKIKKKKNKYKSKD